MLHPLLLRQLKRSAISEDAPPTKAQWQAILEIVNKTYAQFDQERYIIERSMAISSEEIREINSKLEHAQQIARMSYWAYTVDSKVFEVAEEMYELLDINYNSGRLTFECFANLLLLEGHKSILQALLHSRQLECDVRHRDDQQRWFHLICHQEEQALSKKISGILIDISQRKKNEKKYEALNQKLIDTARRVGVAEVTTSVLHNIGNVLNSVNVSVEMIKEIQSNSRFMRLFEVGSLLEENRQKLTEYLTQDRRGKLIPEYLMLLISTLRKEHNSFSDELSDLASQVSHLRGIVETQQNMDKTLGIVQQVKLSDLIDSALKITGIENNDKGIAVERYIENIPDIKTDKSKLLQVLVNLLQNAQEAVLARKSGIEPLINIEASLEKSSNNIVLKITDNGVGIKHSNLKKIYNFGFTTKKEGHGFGLHSSALLAKELKGDIKGYSHGADTGATFVLTLPLELAGRVGNHVAI